MAETEKKLLEKVSHYRDLTESALKKVEPAKGLSAKEKKTAVVFLSMARDYFSDAKHFEETGDLLNALAAFSYAHAWLDAGVKSKILDGKRDEKLFTLP